MRHHTLAAATLTLALLGGCHGKKADNRLNFTNAINTYYSTRPVCLWGAPQQFPTQVETSDTDKAAPFDALVNQGLLVRTTAQKTVMLVISKQVNNYDLSDKGRSAWTVDTTQPGFGNFCYGHRKVTTLDSSSPTTDDTGATTQVAYRYSYGDAPAWATAAEVQTAFPDVHANLSGAHITSATLTNTSEGWALTSPAAN